MKPIWFIELKASNLFMTVWVIAPYAPISSERTQTNLNIKRRELYEPISISMKNLNKKISDANLGRVAKNITEIVGEPS